MTLPEGYFYVPAGHLAAVVTYLEMREWPRDPAPAPPAGMELRLAPCPGVEWYRNLFRAVGENCLWFSRLRMSDSELAGLLQGGAVDVFTLVHEGADKGIVELDRRGFPDIELTFFGVTPDLVGRGLGRYLLRFACERAWAYAPRRIFVRTCTLDHPRALGLYLKAGFRPYQRAVEIAQDPRLTGELPRSAAPRIPLL